MIMLEALLLLLLLAEAVRIAHKHLGARIQAVPDVALLLATGLVVAIISSLYPVHLHHLLAAVSVPEVMAAAASLILYYGGAELTPAILKLTWKPIVYLAVVGVVISTGVLGGVVSILHLGGLAWMQALLLGAVLAGTDPSVLVSVLDQIPINERVREMLIAESALNDPMSALLATALLTFSQAATPGALGPVLLSTLWQITGAVILSLLIWFVITKWGTLLRSYPLLLFIVPFAAALVLGSALHVSLYLSCFLTGLMTRPLQTATDLTDIHRARSHHQLQRILYYTRAYIFLLLGLSVSFAQLTTSALAAAFVAILLVFLARPVSVLVVKWLSGPSLSKREALFLAANRQTGVIPALFAGVLVDAHVPDAGFIQLSVIASVFLTSVLLLPLFGNVADLCKMSVHNPSV